HVGFNEPSAALAVRTHRVRLHPATRRTNAEIFGGHVARVPREGLTMGMGTILRARRIVLIATGAHKTAAVEPLLNGTVRTRFSASLLQLRPHAEVWLDRAAAGTSGSRGAVSTAPRRPRRSRRGRNRASGGGATAPARG